MADLPAWTQRSTESAAGEFGWELCDCCSDSAATNHACRGARSLVGAGYRCEDPGSGRQSRGDGNAANHERAEHYARRALEIANIFSGQKGKHTAVALNNLAQLLEATNRLEESEPLMRRALQIVVASLGPIIRTRSLRGTIIGVFSTTWNCPRKNSSVGSRRPSDRFDRLQDIRAWEPRPVQAPRNRRRKVRQFTRNPFQLECQFPIDHPKVD
ncbi:MAG: hypothetical protein CMO80_12585 [Verrucomicrobiales bacterium]|nr:hypothetical protein [Verrucomicrobiales bacterium]